eukprot:TRINITY_DN10057_c0_g1_i11.p1 TRINITY_DN10057_c0_g1~~TRINITY_DN10057_c0_g1_i11.p1  ORF type:complete len:282 (+),score=65.38 TRINITY_DN10057_c0_g1_i11:768-1613(+)
MANLDDLLADALDDFDAQDTEASRQTPQGPATEAATNNDGDDEVDALADQLADEFLAGLQTAADSTEVNDLVERLMSQLGTATEEAKPAAAPAVQDTSASRASAQATASAARQDADSAPEDMEQVFTALLQNLSQETGSDMKDLLDGLLDETADDGNDFTADGSQAEQDSELLGALLSKELMYPSIKQLHTLYPSWLSANASTLSDEDRARYSKQQSIIGRICQCYESDDASPAAVKALISQMSECGPPPPALVQEMGVDVDEQGRPQLPFAEAGQPCAQM